MKRLAVHASVAIATLLVALALWKMRDVVVAFIFSLAISAAAEGLVDLAVARGMPRRLAIALVYVLGLVAVGLLLYLTLGSILGEAKQAADDASRALVRVRTEWPHGNLVARTIAANLEGVQIARIGEDSNVGSLVTGALGVTMDVFSGVAAALITLILSLYWTLSTASFERVLLSVFPSEYRSTARGAWHDMKVGVGEQLRRTIGQTALAILALEVGFHLMGLRYATVLALTGGLGRGIPLGRFVVVLALAIATGLTTTPLLGVCAGAYTLGVFVLLQNLIGRTVFDDREHSSFVLVVMVMALVELFGVVGLIVAPGVAAAVEILGEHLLSDKRMRSAAAHERGDLDQRLQEIQAILATRGDPPRELKNLVERLSALIDEAETTTSAVPGH